MEKKKNPCQGGECRRSAGVEQVEGNAKEQAEQRREERIGVVFAEERQNWKNSSATPERVRGGKYVRGGRPVSQNSKKVSVGAQINTKGGGV